MTKEIKPTLELIGQDGNIFNLLGAARRRFKELKKEEPDKDWDNTNKVFMERVTTSESYDEAMSIFQEYFSIT